MAVNIGPRIGIDGEAQYRKQLQNIVQTQKTLKSEMEAVSSAFDENTSAEEKNKKTSENLEKQIEQQKKKLELQNKMLQEAAQKYGETDSKTQKWQQAVNESTRDLNKMEKELKNTNSNMDEVGDTTQDTGKAMDDAGDKASVFGDVLSANLASKAITAGLGALKDAIVGIGEAMADAMDEATDFADDILTLSVETGLATDTLQEFKYMEGLVDTDLSTMTGALAKLTKNMSSARDGSKKTSAAFENLGVSVTDGNGYLRDNEEVFWDVIDALSEVQNETERDALAMDIFGKSAQELNPLIAAGSDRLAELAEEAHNAGYVMSEEQLGALGATQDAFDRWDKTLEGAKRQLITAFAPAVEHVTSKLVDLTQDVDWESVSENIEDWASQFIDFFDEIDWDSAFQTIEDGAAAIGDAVQNIDWQAVGDGILAVVDALGAFGGWLMDVGPVVGGVLDLLGDSLRALFLGDYGPLADDVVGCFETVRDGVESEFGPAMDEFKNDLIQAKEDASSKWEQLKTDTATAWEQLKTDTVSKAGEIRDNVQEKWSTLKSDALTKWEGMKTDAGTKWGEMRDKIKEKIDGIKKDVDEGVAKLKKAFDFKWELPKIKTPHFKVSGGQAPWGFGGQGSLPSISVRWYRAAYDEPLVLSDPTIFGYSGGSLLGGGDGPGEEIVAGADKLMNMIRDAVAVGNNYSGMREAVREGLESATVTIQVGERSAKRTLRDLGVTVSA
jgi:hypothetical protein